MTHEHRPRILVIDNDDSVVRAITTRLDAIGYDCVAANTGAQGLARFAERPADLVVTDLNMPMLDGEFLLAELRAISRVPIIVVTGFAHDYARVLAIQPNVTVLRKPFHTDDLIDMVELELELAAESRRLSA